MEHSCGESRRLKAQLRAALTERDALEQAIRRYVWAWSSANSQFGRALFSKYQRETTAYYKAMDEQQSAYLALIQAVAPEVTQW